MIFFMSVSGEIFTDLTSIPLKWLYVAVFVAFLQFVVKVVLVLWQVSKKPVRFGVMRLSQALIDAVSSVALVVILSLSWQGRVGGIFVAAMCVATIAGYYLIREGWLVKSFDVNYAKDALSYGFPLIPHALGGLTLGMADRFIVNHMLNVSSTGVYVVAVQLGLILGILADSFNNAFAPWLMEKLDGISHATQCLIVRITYIYFFSIISLAVLGGVISPLLLTLIVGPEFQSAGDILIYIFVGNAFMGMYLMVANYIFFSGRTGLLSVLTVTTGILTVTASWFLTKKFGLKGAAIGFMFGQLGLFLGAWVLSHFCVPMPWFKVLTRKFVV
jgi:O-antigen/teichoic acid export membrane protein